MFWTEARILEWGAISFSNAWKWKVKVKSLSHAWLLATPWTAAYQAPLSVGFSRQEYWSGVPLPSPSRGTKNTQFPLLARLAPKAGVQGDDLVPYMGWGHRCVQGLGCRGGLGGLPTPLVVLSAGAMCSTLLLLPTPSFCSWLFRSHNQDFFWSFHIFFLIICPNCTCTQLFSDPYSFFIFCCSRKGLTCLSLYLSTEDGGQIKGNKYSVFFYTVYVKCRARRFIYVVSFSPHNESVVEVLSLPFYRWGKRLKKRLTTLEVIKCTRCWYMLGAWIGPTADFYDTSTTALISAQINQSSRSF